MRHLPIITTSSMRTFRRCAREYHWRYERGLRATGERAAALRFGTALHCGLEAYLERGEVDTYLDLTETMDPFERAKLFALLHGYVARWEGSGWEVLAVESEFRMPLVNPVTSAPSKTWELAGKLDALVKIDGRVWIVEHKTTSEDISVGSQYWERLRLDSQVSNYFLGARSLGYDPVGCIYDVVRKPQLRPLLATPIESRKYTKDGRLYATQREQDETPEEYFQRLVNAISEAPDKYFVRGEVVRFEEEELDARHDAWQLGRLIRDAQLASRWPRNPDACERYGRMCDYWPICTRSASPDDPTRFAVEPPHSELSEETKAVAA